MDRVDVPLQTIDESFSEHLESLQTSLDRQQATLIREFSALESALSQLQSSGSFVSAQLANRSENR